MGFYPHQDLNLARLPISPQPRTAEGYARAFRLAIPVAPHPARR
jgi:hypothetical protein